MMHIVTGIVILILLLPTIAVGQSDDDACKEMLATYEGGAPSATAAYNAACCLSLSGKVDDAFATLGVAMERGYKNADWMESDADLVSLHKDPRWSKTIERCRKAMEAYLATINRELYEMFQEDQSDRRGNVDWSEVGPRDETRRQRALEMVGAKELHAPDDFVHASFIFQHGSDSESYKLAHDLAMKAVELDSTLTRARWIAAATKDRYLQSIGEPQIYGTQRRLVDGVWTLDPIDPTAVTDEDRARWGVPPLASARERVKKMNAKPKN